MMRKRLCIATILASLLLAGLFIAKFVTDRPVAMPAYESTAMPTPICPPDPPTLPPPLAQATLTPRATYTPDPIPTDTPIPTCPATATVIVRDTPTPLPTATFYPTNTPYPASASDPIIWFEEGFEGLAQAPQAGPSGAIPASYYPFDFVEQGNGSFSYDPARNIIALEKNIVHSGQTSLRFEMARQAPIDYDDRRINVGIEWDKRIPDDEAFVSFWLFLPTDFVASSWITILDFRQGHCQKSYIYLIDRPDGTYMKFRNHWYNRPDGAIDPGDTQATHPIPKGVWVRVQAYYHQGFNDGEIIVWHDIAGLDDAEVLNVSGFTSHTTGAGCDVFRMLWRYYSQDGPNEMYWDNMVVADRWVERDYVPGN